MTNRGDKMAVPHYDHPIVYHKYVVQYVIETDHLYEYLAYDRAEPALWPGSADSLLQAIIDFASERQDSSELALFPGGFYACPWQVFEGHVSEDCEDITVVPLDEWFDGARKLDEEIKKVYEEQPKLKILYVWTSKSATLSAEDIESLTETAITSSVVVLNGRIVKCRYSKPGERWTSPRDYIKKHNLAPCSTVIERIEIFEPI